MKTLLASLALTVSLAFVGCASTGATTNATKADCDDPNCKSECDKAAKADGAKPCCDDPNCKGECDKAAKADCTGDCDKADCDCKKGTTSAAVPADAIGTEATCPISGEKFAVTAETTFSEYQGKNYYFCCPGCKGKFDADPAAHAK